MAPSMFAQTNNNTISRDISLSDIIYGVDFIRSNSIYNRTIDYGLDNFNPFFGVIEPFGLATPNRKVFLQI